MKGRTMRILGLDLGDKRIGVAISDPLGLIAQGLDTIELGTKSDIIKKVCQIADLYKAETVVIGLPKNMDGSIGLQGEKALLFGEELKLCYNGEIAYYDERLTSRAANAVLLEDNLRRIERKKKIDRVAAVLILQGYLDSKNNNRREG
jgi:putative Holliday junction resolvase